MDENVEFPIVWALIDSIRAVGRKIFVDKQSLNKFLSTWHFINKLRWSPIFCQKYFLD